MEQVQRAVATRGREALRRCPHSGPSSSCSERTESLLGAHAPNCLPQVLRGYKDRTQAVELLRELELFEIEPAQAEVATGAFSRSFEGRRLSLADSA